MGGRKLFFCGAPQTEPMPSRHSACLRRPACRTSSLADESGYAQAGVSARRHAFLHRRMALPPYLFGNFIQHEFQSIEELGLGKGFGHVIIGAQIISLEHIGIFILSCEKNHWYIPRS